MTAWFTVNRIHDDTGAFNMRMEEWKTLPLKRSWSHTGSKGEDLRTEVRLDTFTGVDLKCTFKASLLQEPTDTGIPTTHRVVIQFGTYSILILIFIAYLMLR